MSLGDAGFQPTWKTYPGQSWQRWSTWRFYQQSAGSSGYLRYYKWRIIQRQPLSLFTVPRGGGRALLLALYYLPYRCCSFSHLFRLFSGNIRVLCRVKPVLKEDNHEEGQSVVVTTDPNNESCLSVLNKGKGRIFEMDKVFHPHATQEEVSKWAALAGSIIITNCWPVCVVSSGLSGDWTSCDVLHWWLPRLHICVWTDWLWENIHHGGLFLFNIITAPINGSSRCSLSILWISRAVWRTQASTRELSNISLLRSRTGRTCGHTLSLSALWRSTMRSWGTV